MTYQEAVAYAETLVNYEHQRDPRAMREMKLARMRKLCLRLGDPQRRFRSILVAGTNGKGSVCAMLYAMLRVSELRVGLYTSPHVEHLRERIRVHAPSPEAGEPIHGEDWISEADFAALVEELHPIVEEMRRDPRLGPPTYFEFLTAMAFAFFSRRGVEIAVLEVGLGGRLDATNVVEQEVSVLAPIDVDHAEILGAEPVAIAMEKAGIIKPHQTVLSAPQQPGVAALLQSCCEEEGVPLWSAGQEPTVGIHQHDLDGLRVSLTTLRGIYESLEIPLIGRHQAFNAALAVGALEALANEGVPYAIVERGLAQVQWPGRLEAVHEAPLVLMDGAHNPHAIQALASTLQELCAGRRVHCVVGVSSDKSVEAMGTLLGPLASSITCAKSRHPRALDPRELARRLSSFCRETHVMSDAADALTYLLNAASREDVIVVTGSLFLVGELRAALRQSHVRRRSAMAAA